MKKLKQRVSEWIAKKLNRKAAGFTNPKSAFPHMKYVIKPAFQSGGIWYYTMDDIFNIWQTISGIIRVKTPNARLFRFKPKLSNPIFHIPSTHLTNCQSSKISAIGTLYTIPVLAKS